MPKVPATTGTQHTSHITWTGTPLRDSHWASPQEHQLYGRAGNIQNPHHSTNNANFKKTPVKWPGDTITSPKPFGQPGLKCSTNTSICFPSASNFGLHRSNQHRDCLTLGSDITNQSIRPPPQMRLPLYPGAYSGISWTPDPNIAEIAHVTQRPSQKRASHWTSCLRVWCTPGREIEGRENHALDLHFSCQRSPSSRYCAIDEPPCKQNMTNKQ